MMIRNYLLILWVSILFAACASDKKCDYSGETVKVVPGQIIFSLPSSWHIRDSSYIVSPGLIDSKTYFSSDSSEYATIDYYDLSNSSTPINHDLLLKKQNSMLRGFMKDESVPITQKEKIIGGYRITVMQGLYFDTTIQKQIVICLGLVDGGRKYSELIIRRKEDQRNNGLQEINCIMESLRQ